MVSPDDGDPFDFLEDAVARPSHPEASSKPQSTWTEEEKMMAHFTANPTQIASENSQNSPKTTRFSLVRRALAATALAGIVLSTSAPLITSGSAAELAPRLPNDPRFLDGSLWGMEDIGAPEVWARTTGSFQTTVAVLDTGVDYTHPDLYENIWINQNEIPTAARAQVADVDQDGLITFIDLNADDNTSVTDSNGNGYIDGGDLLNSWSDGEDNDANGYTDDIIGWDFKDNDNDPQDEFFHGTHVAGTIGAVGDNGIGVVGVNWRVQIMVVRNTTSDLDAAANAIRYAVDNGASISNHSYSIPLMAGETTDTVNSLRDAVAYAQQNGHIIVAASGNGESFPVDPLEVDLFGKNIDSETRYPASFNLDNVVAVGATDSTGRLTHFSNFGVNTVELAAPGFDIVSTMPTFTTSMMSAAGFSTMYEAHSGTSMATPMVVGLLALLRDLDPNASHQDLIAQMLDNTTPTTQLETMTVSGGALNASAAISAR
jgi:subtilisin family serine protease